MDRQITSVRNRHHSSFHRNFPSSSQNPSVTLGNCDNDAIWNKARSSLHLHLCSLYQQSLCLETTNDAWTLDTFYSTLYRYITETQCTSVLSYVDLTLQMCRGPCVSVDTACASSLVATALASASLRDQKCTSAAAAGVNLTLARRTTRMFQVTFSPYRKEPVCI